MSTNKIEDMVFVGFNKQVIALDRYDGKKIWDWKSPKGSGYPAILIDGDRIIVSVHGYTYCLEPTTGSLVWENELKGYGMGITAIASVRGRADSGVAAQLAQQAAAAKASSSSHHGASG
jgi:outer membrane protein assembly factor BamB